MSRRNNRYSDRYSDQLSDNTALRIVRHPALWFFAATIALIGGAISLWENQQHTFINQDEYRLTADRIQISNPPTWTEFDLHSMLLEQFAAPPSLLDVNLVPKAAKTFESLRWIESVNRVEKVKTGLEVDLEFRHPVAQVTTIVYSKRAERKIDRPLGIVDRQGVLMDEQLVARNAIDSLLRITVFAPETKLLEAWSVWQDRRIVEAASICQILQPFGRPWGIYRVFTNQPHAQSHKREPFVLMTGNGVEILWGNAPGSELQGEASAPEKITALQKFVAEHGSLEGLNPNKRIDVRNGSAIIVANNQTASFNSLLETTK